MRWWVAQPSQRMDGCGLRTRAGAGAAWCTRARTHSHPRSPLEHGARRRLADAAPQARAHAHHLRRSTSTARAHAGMQ